MGEVYTSGKRGGKPKQIDGFTGSMQIITETTTWTCPATGEYYISCIGQGGMHQQMFDDRNVDVYVATGGGGGIAESKLKLQKGNKIKITIDAGVSSFGSHLSATGGENANIYGHPGNKSKGGSGTGGNVGNFNGIIGTNHKFSDGDYAINKIQGGGTNASAKYGGAAGGIISNPFYDNTAPYGNTIYFPCTTPANLGIYPYGSSQGSCVDGSDYGGPAYGVDGYVKNGAVIIEYMG